jgi:hypothetical protein
MAQTSVETIEEQIDFEISKLEIDFNNGVQWSMHIIRKSLLRIKRKAEQAEEIHHQEIIDSVTFGQNNSYVFKKDDTKAAKKYYKETFKK